MTILNPPFQEFPKTDHQAYIQALATTQMQQPVGNAIITAYGSVRDYIIELYRQSIKAKLIGLAPPDALTEIGKERGMPQGPSETSAAYASRLLNAFNTWPWAGTAYGLLQALSSTGYKNVVLAQVTGGKQFTLDNGGTNLSVWSADPTNTTWTKLAITTTRNASATLDGTITSTKLIETAVNSIHSHAELNVAVNSGEVHLYSRYVHSAERTKCFLIAANTGFTPNPLVEFDLSAVTATPQSGSGTTLIASGIQSLGSGWFRIWMACQVSATGLGDFHLELGDATGLRTYLGVVGNGLFMSWPQRELITGASAASVPGAYSQTYGVNKPIALVAGTLLTSTMANGIWETDALSSFAPLAQAFWSKFDVIFPLPLQAPSFSWAGGIPSSVSMEANFIRAIIQAWKPAHATVNRIAIHQQGKLLGYPATQVLGASNSVLGGAATIWTP